MRYRTNTQGHLHTPGSKHDSSGTKWKSQRHASALDPSPSLLYYEVGLILIKATLLRGMWVGEHALCVNILLILLTTFILVITPSNTNCISLTRWKYHQAWLCCLVIPRLGSLILWDFSVCLLAFLAAAARCQQSQTPATMTFSLWWTVSCNQEPK